MALDVDFYRSLELPVLGDKRTYGGHTMMSNFATAHRPRTTRP